MKWDWFRKATRDPLTKTRVEFALDLGEVVLCVAGGLPIPEYTTPKHIAKLSRASVEKAVRSHLYMHGMGEDGWLHVMEGVGWRYRDDRDPGGDRAYLDDIRDRIVELFPEWRELKDRLDANADV
jgi:hypothetical protein